MEAPAVILLGLAGVVVGVKGLKVESRKSEGHGASRGRDEKNPTSYSLLATRYLAILATLYFIIRAYFSPVADLGMEDLMLILPAALLYFIAAYGVHGKSGVKLRQGLAWVVILLLLCHLTSSVYQLQGEEGFSLARYFTSTVRSSEGSVTGMYGYYGSFANFAVIAGMLCLSFGVWGRMKLALRACLFLLGLLALGLAVWSQSRSAALSLVVALAVFGVLLAVSLSGQREKVKHRGRVLLLVLGVAGLALSVAGGMWVFQSRAGNDTSGMADIVFDSGVRIQFWSMAAEQWVDHPVVGAGSRSYSYECFRYWNPNLTTGQANPEFVHNEYLQLLADYGLLGLLFVMGLFGVHFYRGGKQVHELAGKVGEDGLKRGSNALALTIAGMCGMTAMAVHVVSDFRTHLLANLLLLVCCAIWVLPVGKSRSLEVGKSGSREVGVWMVSVVLIALGFSASYLGFYHLNGGLPLLEHQMAKEDGAWTPEKVDRSVWIPVLEESVSRVPQYNRYLRLGTLYRLEAAEQSGEGKKKLLQNAKDAYRASIQRNPFNPIPQINLAQIYAEAGEFEKSDQAYAGASEMAKTREKWFRMHSEWAKLHQRWALQLWLGGSQDQAEEHFIRAKKLLKLSYEYAYFYQNRQWVEEYTGVLAAYARFLDSEQRYQEAEVLFAEGREQVNWYNWQRYTALNFYYAQHLYDQGYASWMDRKPQEAYQMMLKAKKSLIQYRGVMKGKVDDTWQFEMDKIQEVIDFLKNAGVDAPKS